MPPKGKKGKGKKKGKAPEESEQEAPVEGEEPDKEQLLQDELVNFLF